MVVQCLRAEANGGSIKLYPMSIYQRGMRIRVVSWGRSVALWALLFYFSVCLVIPAPTAIAELDESDLEFYAYSNSNCQPCVERMTVLNSTYPGAKIVVHELADSIDYFESILDALNETLSREVVPHYPLVGVFEKDSLRAITDGAISVDSLRYVVEGQHEGVLVYFEFEGGDDVNQTFDDPDKIALFEELFKREGTIVRALRSFFSLVIPVATAALVDAINPCAFNSFVVFLTFTLFGVGRRRVLKIGLAFSAAIFLVYFSLGLGLIRFLSIFPWIKYIIAVFAGVLGVLRIIESFGRGVKHVPTAFAERISARLESALSPRGGFVAGAVTASLLLPCTSAPYFVALDLLSRRATLLSGLGLLVVYNLIIVLPFVAMTMGVHALSLSTMDIKLWVEERRRWINLAVGVALIVLSFITLL